MKLNLLKSFWREIFSPSFEMSKSESRFPVPVRCSSQLVRFKRFICAENIHSSNQITQLTCRESHRRAIKRQRVNQCGNIDKDIRMSLTIHWIPLDNRFNLLYSSDIGICHWIWSEKIAKKSSSDCSHWSWSLNSYFPFSVVGDDLPQIARQRLSLLIDMSLAATDVLTRMELTLNHAFVISTRLNWADQRLNVTFVCVSSIVGWWIFDYRHLSDWSEWLVLV